MDTALYHQPLTAKRGDNPSILLAEPRDSHGSFTSMPRGTTPHPDHASPLPITLGLAIRRTRLVAFTVSMVLVIVGLTLFFRHGVALTYFESHAKNATEQTKLLDDYNSYSGNVASMFAKPIELFVTVAVQVIVLRFMADTFTRPEMSWKISAMTLLVGAGIGYLIGNGFNALNVQLRPQKIQTVISERDLGFETNFTLDNRHSRYNSTVSERQDKNLVANTMLQSAIIPKQFRQSTLCAWSGTDNVVKEAFVNLGFMQRDWQGRILQEAPATAIVRVIVNPTNASINNHIKSADLPMNASIAADLFYHGITIGTSFFPWGKRHAFGNKSNIVRQYPVNDSKPHFLYDSTAKLYGLLPPNETVATRNESMRKAWVLRESAAAMARQFAFANRTKTSDLVMEFSHTQITPTIIFDAVTFEVEIDPMLLATVATADKMTRYTVLDQLLHCPQAERCMINKTTYRTAEPVYDPPAQVFALGACADDDGNEILRSKFTRQNNTVTDSELFCSTEGVATQSMLIVSIGKRLVADALEQNVTATANGTKADEATVTVTNLRKIYTFTVGRLAWEFTDLTTRFNAKCGLEDASECLGLEMELSTPLDATATTNTTTDQRLIVGTSYVPLDLISTPDGPLGLARTNLVLLDEPPQSATATDLYNVLAGDVLLTHNVEKVSWDPSPQEGFDGCSADVEDRIMQTLNNHLYMEHGLQTAYTSAVYFLFMFGSVKDVITVSSTQKSLAFYGNSQAIAVWVSTPAQNMWLTLSGCFVLFAGLLAALIKASWFSHHDHDALANITEPQAIARVMVDDRHYPPLFLHRRVVETQGVNSIDDYAIAGVSLQQQQQHEQQAERPQLASGDLPVQRHRGSFGGKTRPTDFRRAFTIGQ